MVTIWIMVERGRVGVSVAVAIGGQRTAAGIGQRKEAAHN